MNDERLLRDRWWQEEHLINYRLTWLLASQTIVGAAYWFLMHDDDPSLKGLASALPWFGMFSSTLVLLGITAAIYAQRRLWTKFPNVTFPASSGATYVGWFTAWGLAMAFVVAWGYVLTRIYCPMPG